MSPPPNKFEGATRRTGFQRAKKTNGEGLTLSVLVGVNFLNDNIVVHGVFRLPLLSATEHDQIGHDNLVAPAPVSVLAGLLPRLQPTVDENPVAFLEILVGVHAKA